MKLDRVGRYFAELQHQQSMKSREYRMSGASFCIARAYRTHVIRCRLASLLFWHRTEKVEIIQRNYRGHVVRMQFRAMLKVKAALAAKRGQAATLIQTSYRRYIALKKYAVHMEYKEIAKKERLKRKKRVLKDKVSDNVSSGINLYRNSDLVVRKISISQKSIAAYEVGFAP